MILNSFSKTYKQKKVLDFPGFSFKENRVYAIIGANGSGKSTFARITAGFLSADNHTVPFAGEKPSIGYLPQKPYPFRMSVRKNLLLNASGNKAADHQKVLELFTALELQSLASSSAHQLSGGETARMVLARLLMKDYGLLILDEPTAAMDIHSTLRTEDLLKDYCAAQNSTLLLITHSLKQALRMADEILFFHKGQLLEYGPAAELLKCPQKKETQEFLDFYGI